MVEIVINKTKREKKIELLKSVREKEDIHMAARSLPYAEIVIMVIETEREGVHMPHTWWGTLKNDAPRVCAICGASSGPKWPGPIRRPKGEKGSRNLNDGGYCNSCGEKVSIHSAWVDAEIERWNKIIQHPIKTRTFSRRISLFFKRWIDEEYIDPITFIPIRHSQRMSPRQLGPEDIIRSAILKIDVARTEMIAALEAY